MLQLQASLVSYHRIVHDCLKQQVQAKTTFFRSLVQDTNSNVNILHHLFQQPNFNNAWENIVRASMQGRLMPFLALLPVKNVEWWTVTMDSSANATVLQEALHGLKTINTKDYPNPNCANTLQHIANDKDVVERWRNAPGAATGTAQTNHTDPKKQLLIVFGKDWNEFILLHNTPVAVDLLLAQTQEEGASKTVTFYIGISPDFDAHNIDVLCETLSQDELQQNTLLDGSSLASEVHKKPLPWMF
jgi:hypothetical protein